MANDLFSAKYRYAFDLVAKLFAERMRKLGDVPYTAHLFAVCYIVSRFTDDESAQLAALLHDVIEDVPDTIYSAHQLETDFGPEVLRLVRAVSHDEVRYGKRGSRLKYLEQLEEGPVEACLISGADLLHNSRDEIYWLREEPKMAWQVLGGERVKLRSWFSRERYEIIKRRLGSRHPLVKELKEVLGELNLAWQRFEGAS